MNQFNNLTEKEYSYQPRNMFYFYLLGKFLLAFYIISRFRTFLSFGYIPFLSLFWIFALAVLIISLRYRSKIIFKSDSIIIPMNFNPYLFNFNTKNLEIPYSDISILKITELEGNNRSFFKNYDLIISHSKGYSKIYSKMLASVPIFNSNAPDGVSILYEIRDILDDKIEKVKVNPVI